MDKLVLSANPHSHFGNIFYEAKIINQERYLEQNTLRPSWDKNHILLHVYKCNNIIALYSGQRRTYAYTYDFPPNPIMVVDFKSNNETTKRDHALSELFGSEGQQSASDLGRVRFRSSFIYQFWQKMIARLFFCACIFETTFTQIKVVCKLYVWSLNCTSKGNKFLVVTALFRSENRQLICQFLTWMVSFMALRHGECHLH